MARTQMCYERFANRSGVRAVVLAVQGQTTNDAVAATSKKSSMAQGNHYATAAGAHVVSAPHANMMPQGFYPAHVRIDPTPQLLLLRPSTLVRAPTTSLSVPAAVPPPLLFSASLVASPAA